MAMREDLRMDYCKFMVKPGSALKLSKIDPGYTGEFKTKARREN
jgi:hypothetical protein